MPDFTTESVIRPISPHLQAEVLKSGLRDKILGYAGATNERHWRSVFLSTGAGQIETGDEIVAFRAPCLTWIPWRTGRSLRIRPGSAGFYFSVGDEALVDIIGNNPESDDLRLLVDRRIVANMEDEPYTIADAEHAFDMIVRELNRPRNGSWNMVLAQVRSILVFLWRLSGVEEVAVQTQGDASRLLQRFRQLVEMRFRERSSIRQYADALGISHDRLHDICRRELGKTPIQLVHERVLHEARLRLERSAMTVEQVANIVGFRDVSHFSRFFKAKTGLPPARYRDTIAKSLRDGSDIPTSNYADWP
jgi:AraC-like DNA-binding protein